MVPIVVAVGCMHVIGASPNSIPSVTNSVQVWTHKSVAGKSDTPALWFGTTTGRIGVNKCWPKFFNKEGQNTNPRPFIQKPRSVLYLAEIPLQNSL